VFGAKGLPEPAPAPDHVPSMRAHGTAGPNGALLRAKVEPQVEGERQAVRRPCQVVNLIGAAFDQPDHFEHYDSLPKVTPGGE
jgi:hypothetical protein